MTVECEGPQFGHLFSNPIDALSRSELCLAVNKLPTFDFSYTKLVSFFSSPIWRLSKIL